MVTTAAIGSLEYTNDFFSLVIREAPNRPGSYVFYSGISMPRFDPICWGKTGICSNAAFKGLQQLRANVSLFANQRGIVTKSAETPSDLLGGHGTGWYQENALLIEDASFEAVREILEFSARDLVRTILAACQPGVALPAGALGPEAMQRFLESHGKPNYKAIAPSKIAKPTGETADGRC
ncbi:MAG: hypothetical protein A2X56_06995 [Nitrospirae bacterium GWC2_57_13]|jgi:hypothetical protein|nr:MAG: hypothetical protein A2X56_06995 [Nitrospirae bacterium GWC2_57_13]HAS53980.1 hypothetical protein [Nitrospiraceae bacterium]